MRKNILFIIFCLLVVIIFVEDINMLFKDIIKVIDIEEVVVIVLFKEIGKLREFFIVVFLFF